MESPKSSCNQNYKFRPKVESSWNQLIEEDIIEFHVMDAVQIR